MNNILDNLYADYITYMESVAPLESLGDKNSRLRVFRNHVMLNCDWTQSSHSTLSQDEREEAAIFIQALKDVLQLYGADPYSAKFPVVPGFLEDWVKL